MTRSFRFLAVGAALLLAVIKLGCTTSVDPDKGSYTCITHYECGSGYECIAQFKGPARCFKAGECVATEECNGRDDNCDGRVDETFSTIGEACGTGNLGICADGTNVCVDAGIVCSQTLQITTEGCNEKDDDCDGEVDEGFNLQTHDLHCGVCGQACPSGSQCVAATCREIRCDDGNDNDGDGGSDCDDAFCLTRACGTLLNCGTRAPPADGGADGGDGGLVVDAGIDGGVDAGSDDAGMDGGESDAGLPGRCVPVERECGNGDDDDGDGLVDCADVDCVGRTCFMGTVCSQLMCPVAG
jgi:hypothetical protein